MPAQHELSHATVFKTKWPNELFGRIIGFLMIFARDFDKIQHAAHHQYTQNWEKDGELVREPYTLTSYLLWLSGITYWWTRVTRMVRLSRGIVLEPYIRPDQHALVIREARLHMAGYAAIAVLSLAHAKLGRGHPVAGADGGDETGAPVAEHHRASGAVAMSTTSSTTPVRPGPTRCCAGCAGRCPITPRTMRFQACRSGG